MAKKVSGSVNSFVEGYEQRMAKTSPPLVSVVWLDACVDSGVCIETHKGWMDNLPPQGAVMETVGFLLSQNKDWVKLGMERHSERDSGFRRVQDIPSYSICRMEVLRKAR